MATPRFTEFLTKRAVGKGHMIVRCQQAYHCWQRLHNIIEAPAFRFDCFGNPTLCLALTQHLLGPLALSDVGDYCHDA